jgi:hypothetical protein
MNSTTAVKKRNKQKKDLASDRQTLNLHVLLVLMRRIERPTY